MMLSPDPRDSIAMPPPTRRRRIVISSDSEDFSGPAMPVDLLAEVTFAPSAVTATAVDTEAADPSGAVEITNAADAQCSVDTAADADIAYDIARGIYGSRGPAVGRFHDARPEPSSGMMPAQIDEPTKSPSATDAGIVWEVSSDSDSSDSADPVSRQARKILGRFAARRIPRSPAAHTQAQADANLPIPRTIAAESPATLNSTPLNPLAYAARYGHFPLPLATTTQPPAIEPVRNILNDEGYLWNARPPAYSQYLDLEAKHGDTASSGVTGSSDGSLSDDEFIDRSEQNSYTMPEIDIMQKFFPLTSRRFLPKASEDSERSTSNSTPH